MLEHAPAALFVLMSWFFGTAGVLFLDSRPPRTFRWTLIAGGVVAILALLGLGRLAEHTSTEAAYLSFGCAMLVWGWHEMAFLMGLVTGPRRAPCPVGVRGWRRFRYAAATVMHHELALALTLALVLALTFGAPNTVGLQTFLVLWVMRLSAKLNVFLGVRNLAVEFLPEHLRYLETYFARARMNPLMPLSIAGAAAALWLLVDRVATPGAGAFSMVSTTLVASLLALGLLEHVFLAFPVPDAALWRWALRSRRPS